MVKFKFCSKYLLVILILALVIFLSGCGVVPPLNQSPNASFTATLPRVKYPWKSILMPLALMTLTGIS